MKFLIVFPVLFLLLACSDQNSEYKSPDGYDLNQPEIYEMPESLIEISGIAFHKGEGNIVYAEQDEEGAVYILKQANHKIDYLGKAIFRSHGDFEDIAICDEEVLMLQSDGRIFTFPFSEIAPGKSIIAREWKKLLPRGEYESMYADHVSRKIYVLCKNCEADAKKNHKHVSGYVFSLNEQEQLAPVSEFKVSSHDISRLAAMKKIVFKPSAITFNQWTNEWYILSSINKMLVTADTNWQVKQVFKLNPKYYPQPEGMAFDGERNLYISSEGLGKRNGTIFKFVYHKKQ